MRIVSISEARKEFAQLVESARRGTPITITRRGRKVAKLTGITDGARGGLPDLTAFRASLKSARQGRTTIDELRQLERTLVAQLPPIAVRGRRLIRAPTGTTAMINIYVL